MNIEKIGDDIFFDYDRSGPYGSPAIVNSRGELVSIEEHARMADLVIEESLSVTTEHLNDIDGLNVAMNRAIMRYVKGEKATIDFS